MAAGTALGKINVTSILKALERDAVESFRELGRAEKGFEPWLRFGQAMIDLRKSPGIKHGDWMPTLVRLGITYRKARYWMNAVSWASGERTKKPLTLRTFCTEPELVIDSSSGRPIGSKLQLDPLF